MTQTTKDIALGVDLLMRTQDKKNTELAQLIGTTEFTASRKRRGLTPFTTDELYTVARWLGTTTDHLPKVRVIA